jgi:hypothetical protein
MSHDLALVIGTAAICIPTGILLGIAGTMLFNLKYPVNYNQDSQKITTD